MTIYINQKTKEYPLFIEDISLDDSDYAIVEQTEIPSLTADEEETKFVQEDAPILVDGSWKQTWRIRTLTSDEIVTRKVQILRYMLKDHSIEYAEAINSLIDFGLTAKEAETKLTAIR